MRVRIYNPITDNLSDSYLLTDYKGKELKKKSGYLNTKLINNNLVGNYYGGINSNKVLVGYSFNQGAYISNSNCIRNISTDSYNDPTITFIIEETGNYVFEGVKYSCTKDQSYAKQLIYIDYTAGKNADFISYAGIRCDSGVDGELYITVPFLFYYNNLTSGTHSLYFKGEGNRGSNERKLYNLFIYKIEE